MASGQAGIHDLLKTSYIKQLLLFPTSPIISVFLPGAWERPLGLPALIFKQRPPRIGRLNLPRIRRKVATMLGENIPKSEIKDGQPLFWARVTAALKQQNKNKLQAPLFFPIP